MTQTMASRQETWLASSVRTPALVYRSLRAKPPSNSRANATEVTKRSFVVVSGDHAHIENEKLGLHPSTVAGWRHRQTRRSQPHPGLAGIAIGFRTIVLFKFSSCPSLMAQPVHDRGSKPVHETFVFMAVHRHSSLVVVSNETNAPVRVK
jgi:hypothetical protein